MTPAPATAFSTRSDQDVRSVSIGAGLHHDVGGMVFQQLAIAQVGARLPARPWEIGHALQGLRILVSDCRNRDLGQFREGLQHNVLMALQAHEGQR